MVDLSVRGFDEYFRCVCEGMKVSVAVGRVAEVCGVSVRTVYGWKSDGDWDRRVGERRVLLNRELVEECGGVLDGEVKDFRRGFVRLLRGLVAEVERCGEVRVTNVKELVAVMRLCVDLERELDLGDRRVVSADYDRVSHVSEINGLLERLDDGGGRDGLLEREADVLELDDDDGVSGVDVEG